MLLSYQQCFHWNQFAYLSLGIWSNNMLVYMLLSKFLILAYHVINNFVCRVSCSSSMALLIGFCFVCCYEHCRLSVERFTYFWLSLITLSFSVSRSCYCIKSKLLSSAGLFKAYLSTEWYGHMQRMHQTRYMGYTLQLSIAGRRSINIP